MPKVIRPDEVKEVIKDGSVIYSCGFGLAGHAEEVSLAIEESFLNTGHPRDLTLYYITVGNFKDKGVHHYAHEGLLKRVVGAHYGVTGNVLPKLIVENKLEAYNLPQGVLAHLPRNIAGRRPGIITKVGLGTFVDPRIEGGKLNQVTNEDIVEVIQLDGEEWLYYKAPKIDVTIIRGTYADENGNISIEREGVIVESLSAAQAAKACGGIVIAQVEQVVKAGSLHPKEVRIPGILVDYLMIGKPENHLQTMKTYFSPAFNGDIKVPIDSIIPMELGERKVVCRRAAMELYPNAIVNLGIGIPDSISTVAAEEKISHLIHLTAESGVIGGVLQSGLDFGVAYNAEAIIEHAYQFDFYDGGGIDIAFLGLAQADQYGNVNVSRFGNRIVGCGGFINITHNTKKIVFCGSFTADGLEVQIADGKLNIVKEGKNKKFIENVEQITFSGKHAVNARQSVLFVTERAVFQLTLEGLELIEIAPGVDLERDILDLMDFNPIIKDPKLMPQEIFQEKWGGLAKFVISSKDD